jgi:hypothetical protein
MDQAVWEAARAVRPYLDDLVGAAASQVDVELAEILTDNEDDERSEYLLREVLEAHEGTFIFLRRVRDDAPAYRPPQVLAESTGRRYTGPAGNPLPVPADKFACPRGDYVWYRADADEPLPLCPTHRCELKPA